MPLGCAGLGHVRHVAPARQLHSDVVRRASRKRNVRSMPSTAGSSLPASASPQLYVTSSGKSSARSDQPRNHLLPATKAVAWPTKSPQRTATLGRPRRWLKCVAVSIHRKASIPVSSTLKLERRRCASPLVGTIATWSACASSVQPVAGSIATQELSGLVAILYIQRYADIDCDTWAPPGRILAGEARQKPPNRCAGNCQHTSRGWLSWFRPAATPDSTTHNGDDASGIGDHIGLCLCTADQGVASKSHAVPSSKRLLASKTTRKANRSRKAIKHNDCHTFGAPGSALRWTAMSLRGATSR